MIFLKFFNFYLSIEFIFDILMHFILMALYFIIQTIKIISEASGELTTIYYSYTIMDFISPFISSHEYEQLPIFLTILGIELVFTMNSTTDPL